MAQTIHLLLIFSFCIAAATAETNVNICYDDKEVLEKMSEYQKECAEMLSTNGGNEPKMILCVFKKMGYLKDSGDSFDFTKTKEHMLTDIEDEEMKKKLEDELMDFRLPVYCIQLYKNFVADMMIICNIQYLLRQFTFSVIMLAHRAVAVVLVLMSFKASVKANLCFDEKKAFEEMADYQKLCEAALPKSTEDDDKFDVVKMKELFTSKIKNDELKMKVEKELTTCESKDLTITAKSEGYYDCAMSHFHDICIKKE
uniref:Uncharacterized protein n=1 Tax=Strigamia maritima TaxID=126957 RepID=T1JB22_STRMM